MDDRSLVVCLPALYTACVVGIDWPSTAYTSGKCALLTSRLGFVFYALVRGRVYVGTRVYIGEGQASVSSVVPQEASTLF